MDLGERLVAVEPVEGLADRDGVHEARVERDRLGRARNRPHVRKRTLQHCAHLGDGLDRHDGRPGADQERRQLARPGSEVEDDPAGPEVELPREPRDGRGRIGRTPLVIRGGRARETQRGRLVELGGHPRERSA